VPKISEKERFKAFALWFKTNANLLVALATFVLAIVTFVMAYQTKRLADISIEQFKIRAYPTFLLEFSEIKIDSFYFFQEFNIYNKGEITAYDLCILQVLVLENNGNLFFQMRDNCIYNDENRQSSISFTTEIPKESHISIINETPLSTIGNIKDLKYMIIYIKYKVPYDLKFRYGIRSFIFFKENKSLFKWQVTSAIDREKLIKRFKTQLPTNRDNLVKNFFKDYL
jgi:hypothetical protein